MPKKQTISDLVKGKVIKDIEQSYDGCSLHDVTIKFTDGTYLSLMNLIKPDVRATYVYGKEDGQLQQAPIKKRLFRE